MTAGAGTRRAAPQPPVLDDVRAAREVVGRHLPATPLVRAWALSDRLGCELYLKCENLQPIGAFKVRGGVNLLASLGDDERRAGVYASSTGNHGQSVAYAGRLFGVPVRIYMPADGTNPLKLERIRALGAEVRLVGADFDEARAACEADAAESGARYIHSANEPAHVAGVGMLTLEVFDALPDPDIIIVPVGGGSGAAAAAMVAAGVRPETRVIGVQSEAAPAQYEAWRGRHLEPDNRMGTPHEGLATRVPFEMTMRMMWEHLSDFVLVSDDAIDAAIRELAATARLVAEGAGAAATAAVLGPLSEEVRGRSVVAILSGGNLPQDRLAALLAAAP